MRIWHKINTLKQLGLDDLRLQYAEIVGRDPPRTRSLDWLYHNIIYEFQVKKYWDEEVHESVLRRAEYWKKRPTPEQELEAKYKKLSDKELQDLCQQEGLVWPKKLTKADREKLIRDLAFAMAGVQEIYGKSEPTHLTKGSDGQDPAKNGRVRSQRRKRGASQDSLPNTIPELLELKKSADKDLQRRIRKKLRSLDKNWTGNRA